MSELRRCCIPKKYKPVTHCIFDLDGTILETESIYKNVVSSILEEYGKESEYTDEYNITLIGMTDKDTFTKILTDFELPLSFEEIHDQFRERSDDLTADAEFMPGALNLIQHLHLHKIPMAIATSSSVSATEIKFSKKKDIFDLFDHVVCGSTDPEVLFGKPAPDIFIVAARRFSDRPRPHQCLVFEDAVVGIKAAIAAGMQVVMIPDLAVPYDEWKLATLRLDNLDCMVPELFGLPAVGSPVEEQQQSIDEEDNKQEGDETAKLETYENTSEIILKETL